MYESMYACMRFNLLLLCFEAYLRTQLIYHVFQGLPTAPLINPMIQVAIVIVCVSGLMQKGKKKGKKPGIWCQPYL